MGRKEEEGLKLDSGLLGLRWNEAHLLRWIKNLQQVHAFQKQIWKSHFVHLIKFIDFSLSFSLFLSLSLSFSFSFSLSFHHSLTLVMQLATRSSRQEIARSGEIKCGRELSAAPSSARNQNFLCTHHSGLDLFFFLWDHVLNLGSNQGNLYEFKNSLIHFIVSSI